MGRATITGGGTNGLYDIHLDYGADRIQAMIAELAAIIAELTPQVAAKEAELTAKENDPKKDELEQAVQKAIDAYQTAVEENCTAEGWKSDTIKVSFAAYEAARRAYYNHLDILASLKQDLAQPTKDRGEAEAIIPALQQLIGTTENQLESALNLLNAAAECVSDCARAESFYEPLEQEPLPWYQAPAWAGWLNNYKWGAWRS